jgi:hypothetical protein
VNTTYQRYSVSILESKDLNGLTGDKGEKYCVFVKDIKNPLLSGWKWILNMDEARIFADQMRNETKDLKYVI